MNKVTITLRITQEEKDAWSARANREGHTLNTWVRTTLNVVPSLMEVLDDLRGYTVTQVEVVADSEEVSNLVDGELVEWFDDELD